LSTVNNSKQIPAVKKIIKKVVKGATCISCDPLF
jgi:hypothetical protein